MAPHIADRGRIARWLTLVFVGLVFGVLVSAVNHGFGPASDYVSKVIGNGGVWLAAGLGACLLGRGWRGSWASGVAFFWPAVLGYYVADLADGVYTSTSLDDPVSAPHLDLSAVVGDAGAYLVISALVSGLLAVVVLAIRRRGLLGVLGSVAVPVYIAYAALTSLHELKVQPAKFDEPVAAAVDFWLGVTALVATGLLVVFRLRRSSRPEPQVFGAGGEPGPLAPGVHSTGA